ncbi:hypothetical protein TDB9533_04144 [Thalassocella blandensis]|nr:hypothetical protein TDB9533_04144 [Thalassocella blandensis]
MQKIFVLLTLLCASLSGSGVFAESKIEFFQNIQFAYDDSQQKAKQKSQQKTKQKQSLTDLRHEQQLASSGSQSLQHNGHCPSLFAKYNLSLAEGDKHSLEFGEDSDPYLIFEHLIQGSFARAEVKSQYLAHVSISFYSPYGIRAPPVSLS